MMKKFRFGTLEIILVLLVIGGIAYLGVQGGGQQIVDFLENLSPIKPPPSAMDPIINIKLHVGAGDKEDMRCNIGLILGAEGAGPFEGVECFIKVKYLGTGQIFVQSGTLDNTGTYSMRRQFLIPGFYEIWGECSGFKTDPVKLEIRGVMVELPKEHSRADIYMIMKLYANVIEEYDIYVLPNGDESQEWKFFSMSVNAGGYGEKRIWYRPFVGTYWWDARLKSNPSYSADSWGADSFVEVVP